MGVAVAPGNVDEIYEAILLFLNDRSYISRMGKYGREEAKRFTPLEIEQHLQDIYIKLFI